MQYYATMHVLNIKPETVFQALSDPLRIRIVRLLSETGQEACLCELVDSLLEPQYKLSRHIKTLKQAGLLSASKDGRWIYHRLVVNTDYLINLYKMIILIPDQDGQYKEDLQRFSKRMSLRESGRCRIGIQNKTFQTDPPAKPSQSKN